MNKPTSTGEDFSPISEAEDFPLAPDDVFKMVVARVYGESLHSHTETDKPGEIAEVREFINQFPTPTDPEILERMVRDIAYECDMHGVTAAMALKIVAEWHERPPVQADKSNAANKRKERFKGQSLSELMAIADPRWLVEDVLTENALFEIFGSFKAGKTFYGMEMALCIATGLDFFGAKTTQGPVLYITAEGNAKLFGYRVNEWVNAREKDKAKRDLLRAKVEANFKAVSFPVHFDVTDDLQTFVLANPGAWKAVFVDTLMRNMQGDPMKPNDLIAFMAGCDMLRNLPCHPAVIFLHHMRREGGVGGYGPIIGEAFADGTACVTKNKKGERIFQLKDMRDSPEDVLAWVCTIESIKVVMSLEKSRSIGVLTFVRRGEDDPEKRVMVTLYADQPATVVALADKAKVSRRTVYRVLEKLKAEDMVEGDTLILTASGKAIAKTLVEEGMEWH